MKTEIKLFLLYNADSSVFGKINYGYRKLTRSNPTSQPVCAACDITHGGLSFSESTGWKSAKAEIQKESGMNVIQYHRDEVDEGMRKWMETNGVKYPAMLKRDSRPQDIKERLEIFELVMDRDELKACAGDPNALVRKLKEKGLFSVQASI